MISQLLDYDYLRVRGYNYDKGYNQLFDSHKD